MFREEVNQREIIFLEKVLFNGCAGAYKMNELGFRYQVTVPSLFTEGISKVFFFTVEEIVGV
jgi:hypothetical protein